MEILNEVTRTQLISKAKASDTYKGKESNRWTNKGEGSISNAVADFNNINMDALFKKGILSFTVKVQGKTDNYKVYVVFSNVMKRIQTQVKAHKNKLDANIVYQALLQAMNSEDIKISCNCPDYKYRIAYYATQNGTNSGPAENRRSDDTNPDDTKGLSCKHINLALNNLKWLLKIASVITNYINYCKDEMQYNYSKFIFPAVYGVSYDKAVQMSIFDYDDEGNEKDELESDEATLNLSNALGKVRGRYKKGSNRNPVKDKRNEDPKLDKKDIK